MEQDRNRAAKLKVRILIRENEKRELQATIDSSQSPERKKQALDRVATILEEIKLLKDELAKLESE
jgi:hypothetical protein